MTAVINEDWELVSVVHVVDGDTVDVVLSRPVGQLGGWTLTATGPARLRLVHLDTPERGELGYRQATKDLGAWLEGADPSVIQLRVATGGKDVFGRYLADIYEAQDRSLTASDYMVRERNWPVWTG